MLTVIQFLAVAAFIAAIVGAVKSPLLWVSVVLLSLIEMLRVLPLG